MSETETPKFDPITDEQWTQPASYSSRALWDENFIAPRMLLPDHDWIMREVVSKGRGTRAICGRMFGQATEWSDKVVEHQGKTLKSIRLGGDFEFQSFITGEMGSGLALYVPPAYAERARRGLDAGIKPYGVDIAIGVEATGKSIPYRWGVLSFRDDPLRKEVIAMREQIHPQLRGMLTQQLGSDRTAALIGHSA